MSEVINAKEEYLKNAESYEGVWKVVSNKDFYGRQLEVMNQPENPALVWVIRLRDGSYMRCAVNPDDAREFCIGVLHLIEGEMPVVKEAWSPNEASIGPVD